MMRPAVSYLLKWAAVILIAAAMKWFYSQASVNELRWVLAPTAFLVEWVTWSRFTFESYAGYMNREHTFLIAAPCSGVNFLIAAFLLVASRTLWAGRRRVVAWSFLLRSGVLAYLATIAANTIRISIALQTQEFSNGLLWFDAAEVHRLQGIVVYFGSLLVLFLITERSFSADRHDVRRQIAWPAAWPLLAYYGVALGLPLANGASTSGDRFWRHAAAVILIPLILIAAAAGLRRIRFRPYSQ